MKNEMRLIDATFAQHIANVELIPDHAGIVQWVLSHTPTVDAKPVVHGRWGKCGGDLHSSGYAIFCSVCKKTHFVHNKWSLGGLWNEELFKQPKYCPNCGAQMDLE